MNKLKIPGFAGDLFRMRGAISKLCQQRRAEWLSSLESPKQGSSLGFMMNIQSVTVNIGITIFIRVTTRLCLSWYGFSFRVI